jgi:hypothetical protein
LIRGGQFGRFNGSRKYRCHFCARFACFQGTTYLQRHQADGHRELIGPQGFQRFNYGNKIKRHNTKAVVSAVCGSAAYSLHAHRSGNGRGSSTARGAFGRQRAPSEKTGVCRGTGGDYHRSFTRPRRRNETTAVKWGEKRKVSIRKGNCNQSAKGRDQLLINA